MSGYVRSALAWFIFIAAAFAVPAAAARVRDDRSFKCHHDCLTPSLSKWPSQQIRKNALSPQWAAAKNQNANAKSRALAVTAAETARSERQQRISR
jgi:hypothetical protein